jgi:hypothetical protein
MVFVYSAALSAVASAMLIWPWKVDDDGLALADRRVQAAALYLIHQVLQLLR